MKKTLIKILPTLACVASLLSPALAEPPLERVLVTAVADADQDRILIRWRSLEGAPRYSHYDLMRRDAESNSFVRLNVDPIGALQDVASIEALFTAPGRADALGWIQETFGTDYAHDLLRLMGAAAPREGEMQRLMLPDQNYGAALAMGLGYMDEPVTNGATYVYELWGVDERGYAVERLGRASATAGAPGALSAPALVQCVEPGDQRADMAAFLRWNPVEDENHYVFGYEIFRAPSDIDGNCTDPMGPGFPNTVKANKYPVLGGTSGAVTEGAALYASHCTSCHGPRTEHAGRSLEDFRRRQHSDVSSPAGPSYFTHDTADLKGLAPDTLKKIFDYIHEFRFRDDGDGTPADPVSVGRYCYQVATRDLLGQLGPASLIEPCAVKDMIPPEVPANILSERIDSGGYETCQISWDRNDEVEDGTVSYDVLRVQGDPPRNAYLDESLVWDSLAQPPGAPGQRVLWTDSAQSVIDATRRFFYAVRARDASNNVSPVSGWAPCVPRDIVPPEAPLVRETICCEDAVEYGCRILRNPDIPWITQGGEPVVIGDRDCPPRFVYDLPSDALYVRTQRSFDGETWYPEKDMVPVHCPDPQAGEYCFTPDFDPTLDQRIWYRLQAVDSSGNRSDNSGILDGIFAGSAKPPAPQVYSVFLNPSSDPPMPNRVTIRFRSLKPSAVLGFALYTRPSPPTVTDIYDQVYYAIGKGDFVRALPDFNLAGKDPTAPGDEQWVIKAGAEVLSERLDELGQGDEYLLYDEGSDTYEMVVDLGPETDVTLQLTTIAWTGHEGPYGGKTWAGWNVNDEKLDWPRFRENVWIARNAPPPDTDLAFAIDELSIILQWSAEPYGCAAHEGDIAMPFVVFRRREDSPHWKQISPLFKCEDLDPPLPVTFEDFDVENGTWYRYLVIQFDERGEFAWRRETPTLCFDIHEPCEGPAPE